MANQNTLPGFSIEDFKSNFKWGARAHLFYFVPNFPTGLTTASNANRGYPYMVKSTSLPQTSIEEIAVPWQGYDYKIPGKRTFDDFTVTFNVDTKNNIRNAYEEWMNKMINPSTNVREVNETAIMVDQTLTLVDGTGQSFATYTLHNAWPQMVGTATLDYGTTEILSFEVTFKYQYFTTDKVQ